MKPYSANELMEVGINGEEIDLKRALATYAESSNWIQIYDQGTCQWAFIGPMRPGFELARLALK